MEVTMLDWRVKRSVAHLGRGRVEWELRLLQVYMRDVEEGKFDDKGKGVSGQKVRYLRRHKKIIANNRMLSSVSS
ncbi:unnamed protein product, partial [Dovyalis caffra]